jgi:dihydrofolate synthase/folylpolyglutamate synthase
MKEILEKLLSLSKAKSMDFSLDRFRKACFLYSNPQDSFKSIHVAGTNGKGSVTSKIAKSLEDAGFKVGLYTSPHISTFRERIEVNSNYIEEDIAKDLLTDILDKCPELTFFEVMTLLGFNYFRLKKVDYAVIEVGLGGRLDATNIINPELSIITSIDLDHTSILGSTKEAIALEKAGIIKSDTPVVLGVKCHAFKCILDKASQKNAEVIFARPALSTFYDDENNETAKAALNYLGIKSLKGLQFRPRCRFEEVNGIILDVAHNPDGFKRTFEAFRLKFPAREIHLLMGMSKDKDVEMCLKCVNEYALTVSFISLNINRGISPDELLEKWMQLSNKQGFKFKSCQEALVQKPINLVIGSFYIMDEVRKSLKIIEPSDSIVVAESGLSLVQAGG